jgi:glycosyltransferase involved in cell wall biosynthesis
VGGITDIVVHEETGLLVPPGDATALAAAMRRIVSDPALRERLGRGGRERINSFTADAIIPRFQEIYRRVLATVESGADVSPGDGPR